VVEAYQRNFGFELIVLRLANVYGVGHFAGGSSGGEMVQNMLQTGIKGGVAKIPQESARDSEYVYYKDLGRALDKAVTTPLKEPVTLNIGRRRHQSMTWSRPAEKLLPNCKWN